MFKGMPRGTLTANGRPIDTGGLARLVGTNEEEVEKLLQELEVNKVFSRLEGNTIINRRMYQEDWKVRDISDKRSKAGKKGSDSRWGRKDSGQEDEFDEESEE